MRRFGIVMLLLIGLVGCATQSVRLENLREPAGPVEFEELAPASIRVLSDLHGGEVYVNGLCVGTVNEGVEVSPGTHQIEVYWETEGEVTRFARVAEVEAGQDIVVQADTVRSQDDNLLPWGKDPLELPKCIIEVLSELNRARVYVNDTYAGPPNRKYAVSPGTHYIRVVFPDRMAFGRPITIQNGQEMQVIAK